MDAFTPPTSILSTSDCWARVREALVGRLAVITDGHPDIFPVNHVVDHGSLVFRTAEGNKLAGSVGMPVAFEVDGYTPESGSAWSVVVKGVGHLVSDVDDIIWVLSSLTPWEAGRKPLVIRVEPTSISGRVLLVSNGYQDATVPSPGRPSA